jgi:hypothetical protein
VLERFWLQIRLGGKALPRTQERAPKVTRSFLPRTIYRSANAAATTIATLGLLMATYLRLMARLLARMVAAAARATK